HPDRPNGMPAATSQQGPDGNAEVLALEIPQRLVDGTDGSADRHAPEADRPVEREPVVLYVDRITPDQVVGERLDDLRDRSRPCEEGRLAHPVRTVVRR